MSAEPAESLFRQYPRRLDVPALIVGAAVMLGAAHMLPFMVIERFFFDDNYTLLKSVVGMWQGGYYFLAALIFFFSVVFPFVKLGLLLLLWFMEVASDHRDRVLHWLSLMGKWSMLDVFVIAIIVVLTQASAVVSAEPRIGLYLFAGGILLSMVNSVVVERLAKRADVSGRA